MLSACQLESNQSSLNTESASDVIKREVSLNWFCKRLKREFGIALGVPWSLLASCLSHSGWCVSSSWFGTFQSRVSAPFFLPLSLLPVLSFMRLAQWWKVWVVAAAVVRSCVRLRQQRKGKKMISHINTVNQTDKQRMWGGEKISCRPTDSSGQSLKCAASCC